MKNIILLFIVLSPLAISFQSHGADPVASSPTLEQLVADINTQEAVIAQLESDIFHKAKSATWDSTKTVFWSYYFIRGIHNFDLLEVEQKGRLARGIFYFITAILGYNSISDFDVALDDATEIPKIMYRISREERRLSDLKKTLGIKNDN